MGDERACKLVLGRDVLPVEVKQVAEHEAAFGHEAVIRAERSLPQCERSTNLALRLAVALLVDERARQPLVGVGNRRVVFSEGTLADAQGSAVLLLGLPRSTLLVQSDGEVGAVVGNIRMFGSEGGFDCCQSLAQFSLGKLCRRLVISTIDSTRGLSPASGPTTRIAPHGVDVLHQYGLGTRAPGGELRELCREELASAAKSSTNRALWNREHLRDFTSREVLPVKQLERDLKIDRELSQRPQ